MAVGGHYISIPGLVAAADLSSSQFKTVKLASTAGQVKAVAASTDEGIGVLQNAPKSGEEAQVACLGVVKALVEASVSAGNFLGPSATGRLTVAETDNNLNLAYALEGSTTSAGDIILVQLRGVHRY